ncbi:hypothetical protein OSL60_29640, partial [Escherichia coli]|nr:hypothetical protein [Escherichia coli]
GWQRITGDLPDRSLQRSGGSAKNPGKGRGNIAGHDAGGPGMEPHAGHDGAGRLPLPAQEPTL